MRLITDDEVEPWMVLAVAILSPKDIKTYEQAWSLYDGRAPQKKRNRWTPYTRDELNRNIREIEQQLEDAQDRKTRHRLFVLRGNMMRRLLTLNGKKEGEDAR